MVSGGDGTLSEATHQLAHRNVCLGVLPQGTANNFRDPNNFARSLSRPAAVRILVEGEVADVDLGLGIGQPEGASPRAIGSG